MKNFYKLKTVLLLAIAVLQQACGGSSGNNPTKNNLTLAPDPNCINAPASWFTADTTVAPNNYGPFVDTSTTTNCDFHLWAWQKFLSLTRSASSKAPFENLVQVDNDLNKRDSTILILTDSSQAASRGVLYDKTNRAIYYAIFVNRRMYDFQQQYLPAFAKYISNLHSQNLDTLNYPVGCLELKTSWMLTSSLKADSVNYYTTSAKVTTKAGTSVMRVALLGMHVLGRVASHPELIWATFEHDSLVPNYDWENMKGDTISKGYLSVNDYVFYNNHTSINNCPMNNDSVIPTKSKFSSVFNIYKYGMAQLFTDTTFVAPSQADSANNLNIVALNKSVHQQLEKVSGPWKHYFYKGSIWLHAPDTTNFGPGNANIYFLTNTSLRGSRAVSNITMETFTQLDYSGIYKLGSLNCFGCHATADFKNSTAPNGVGYNLALSHLFINALQHRLKPKTPPTP
jgi:hypothetical protein